MELALVILQLLTALAGLATAAVKLYTQSTEQKRTLGDKEGSDVAASHQKRHCPLKAGPPLATIVTAAPPSCKKSRSVVRNGP